MNAVGTSVPRKEAPDKVTGAVKYTADHFSPGLLHVRLATSTYAHALIRSVDTSEALKIPGVLAVVVGEPGTLCGHVLEDRPPLAVGKVRYFGEPVAAVVAFSEELAARGAAAIRVDYEQLPIVNSPGQALHPEAPLIHELLGQYEKITVDVYPEPGTNVAHRTRIRKGDMQRGWDESHVVIEASLSLPQCDHGAMETRVALVGIAPDGRVSVHCSSQEPYMIRTLLSRYFHIEIGKINVHTPLVGGAFGGKATAQLEPIAFLASRAVGGRMVRLVNTREDDFAASPSHIGVEAHIKLGAAQDGRLTALEVTYLVDSGAYSDSGPIMARAMAANCTGPYRVDNVWCDSLCVYTNHSYVTAFRGFGHTEYTFVIERALDKLAVALGMDPLELRLRNAIVPGDTSPTLVKLTPGNLGDLPACIRRLKDLMRWDEGTRAPSGPNRVRAKGMSCLWKTSSSPVDAISGAIVTVNPDGTINLMCGVVEIGQGTKTVLAQILAERMRMRPDQIHVDMEVNTQSNPDHWKTVASMSTFMAGRAVLEAADDLIRKLTSVAAIAMRCPPQDLEVAEGRVYLREDPDYCIPFPEICHGYKYPNGNAIGGQIMGTGSFVMRHLTVMDKETGRGKPGPGWTVGAQAVEVELDTRTYTYRILKAATVIDAGKVMNPQAARGIITGGMSMGLGVGSREEFIYSNSGVLLDPQFRTYKMLRFGENPQYLVDFIEVPQLDAPYGQRGLGEHGIVGMPAALANALSSAAQVDLDHLPVTPERIWRAVGGDCT